MKKLGSDVKLDFVVLYFCQLELLGAKWHGLVQKVAQAGDKCAAPANCHVRKLLDILNRHMGCGNVSKTIYVLLTIQAAEASSCYFCDQNPINKQFCTSSQDLLPVIAKMKSCCCFDPLIKLIKDSVDAVTDAVNLH